MYTPVCTLAYAPRGLGRPVCVCAAWHTPPARWRVCCSFSLKFVYGRACFTSWVGRHTRVCAASEPLRKHLDSLGCRYLFVTLLCQSLHARARRAQAANTTTYTNTTAGRHGLIPPGNASLELLPPAEHTDWAQAVRNQSVELPVARVGQSGHRRASECQPIAPLHSMLAACGPDGAPDARGGCAEYTVSWRVLWCAGGGGEGSRVAAEAATYCLTGARA